MISGCGHLNAEVNIKARPLIEPSLSMVTELLINTLVAANPTEPETRIRNVTRHSTTQRAAL